MVRPTSVDRARAPWTAAMAGAAVGLLVTIVLSAPARWIAGAVGRATGGQLVLNDARGTIWNGSAQVVLTGGAGSQDSAALPTRADWRVRPTWGGLRAELTSTCCTPQPLRMLLTLRPTSAVLRFDDAAAQFPASLLAGLGTPWNTLRIEGDLQLATQALSVEWFQGRSRIAGRAELTAQRVSSRLSTLRPMGSYRITLVGGATPTLQLSTLEGSLQLSGTGEWLGSRLRFSGEAVAAPDREAALSNLLNIIGRRSGARSIITIG